MEITQEQIDIVGHSLGVNVYHAMRTDIWKDKQLPNDFYRNRYQHNPTPELEDLVEKGLMEKNPRTDLIYYHVSDEGIEFFKNWFIENVTKKAKKPSRSKLRYQRYLELDLDIPFIEYCKYEKEIESGDY